MESNNFMSAPSPSDVAFTGPNSGRKSSRPANWRFIRRWIQNQKTSKREVFDDSCKSSGTAPGIPTVNLDNVRPYANNMRKIQSGGRAMETATVGQIQKNFAEVLKKIKSGEEVIVTRRGKPVAKITALGAQQNIDWPDFFQECIELKGKPLSQAIIEGREDRL
jgi:prevent-host-death family protein